jgi:non-ribosomal peptide synthetase component F
MDSPPNLHRAFLDAAARFPEQTAVIEPGDGAITYRRLGALSDRVRDRLHALGVRPGDRVGICLRKSIDAVASIYGILKTGAAYVPVDAGAPASRNAYIMHNCAVRAVIIENRFADAFRSEHGQLGPLPELLLLEGTGAGRPLAEALDRADANHGVARAQNVMPAAHALAYILYTSGSTGKPKGVMLSHENAVSFVDWCSEAFSPESSDRFSSHAPFHFDLSILDIHVSLKHGATLVLVPEERGKDPQHRAELIASERITIW